MTERLWHLRAVDAGYHAADNCEPATPGTRFFPIMRKAIDHACTSALPAIAAALALSSTPAFAQEVPAQPQPTTTQPTPTEPTVSTTPAPAVDSTTSTDTTISTPDVAPAKTTTTSSTRTARAAKPIAVATSHKTVRQTVTRTAHAAVPAAAAPAVAPKPAPAPAANPAPAPVVDMAAKPAQPVRAAPAKPANGSTDTALEIGGGALALLAIGAGAWALSRRRRDEDEVVYEESYEPEGVALAEPMAAEPMPRHDPVFEEQPAIVGPDASAFAWGKEAPAERADDDGSDRRPGETWVERAYRGPSPANPSVSLKNRLRRAAFFDKRERDVAAGKAEPVEADAGLPDAMTEEPERELA